MFIIYRNDSIRGAFVMAGGHGGQVLVNVVCDISPDNVKSLTSAATKIGLDNNLQQVIEMKFHKGTDRCLPAQMRGPSPPRSPATASSRRHIAKTSNFQILTKAPPVEPPRGAFSLPFSRKLNHFYPGHGENNPRRASIY